ncbi:MAG TPA: ABC transporter ATP-binding protein [Anaerolineae bacterium]|nr:ABC transporter ATP-binding protein [Anaerolineae bacterium]
MSTIRFESVSKQYPRAARPAVDACSFSVQPGSLTVILGPSGCGKTTLLKLVNRLVEPTSGAIYLDEADIRQIEATLLRRQIGYVIQQAGLFPHMTVAANIAVVPRLLGWTAERIETRVDELLTLIDLPPEEYRRRYPAQLSGGQQQRVGLARALAGDPRIMLMDEPFAAVDAIARANLQDALVQLRRTIRKTILFVTHDVEEALRLADHIVVLREGRIEQADTPFNILTRPANHFVHELIGASDIVRQLSLLGIEQIMEPLPAGYTEYDQPAIAFDSNLRQALSTLLRSGASAVTVMRDNRPVGIVTLDRLRASAREVERA